MNIHETAQALGIKEQWVRLLAREGKLKGCKLGRAWSFLPADVEKALRERRKLAANDGSYKVPLDQQDAREKERAEVKR